jgi:hypothetical protein
VIVDVVRFLVVMSVCVRSLIVVGNVRSLVVIVGVCFLFFVLFVFVVVRECVFGFVFAFVSLVFVVVGEGVLFVCIVGTRLYIRIRFLDRREGRGDRNWDVG